MRTATLVLALVACTDDPEGKTDGQTTDTGDTDLPTGPDADGDGSPDDADCDDVDPTVRPGIAERCDGIDTDCDEATPDPVGQVGLSSGGGFDTLADAAAVAVAGDTLWLCEGTFGGTAVITADDVTVTGLGAVTLDAGQDGPAIEVRADGVVISDLRVTNGVGSADGPQRTNGGGINANSSTGPVALVRVIVEGNQAEEGGGVLFGEEGGSLEDCEVRDNVAGQHGGGVFSVGSLTIDGAIVEDNVASGYGGGVAIAHQSVLTVTEATIRGNVASNGGGVFAFQGALVDLGDALVTDNIANSSGGGVYLQDAELVGGSVVDNTSASQAGGVMVYDGGAVTGTEIRSNEAPVGAGLVLEGSVDLNAVEVSENLANENGGGAYVFEAVVTAVDTTFRGNSAVVTGGGLLLIDSSFTGGTVLENEAPDGAGAFVSASGNGGSSFTDTEITDNTAGTSGAGIYAAEDLSLEGVTLSRNVAAVRAGGVYLTAGATGNFTDTVVFANRASDYAGGVYANDGATLTAQDVEVTANVAGRGGGFYINNASTVTLLGGLVERNGDPTTETGGGVRIADGTLVSTGCNWGEGATENLPDDVYVPAGATRAYVGYTTAETFSCDNELCAPAP